MENTIYAGKIIGSPLNGLCERVCIEVSKVFDGCVARFKDQTLVIKLSGISPNAVAPFTYISTTSVGESVFYDITIVESENGCSRVSGKVKIPVTSVFSDAKGNIYSGVGEVITHRDMMLFLPQKTLAPYQFKTSASLKSTIGSFIDSSTVSINSCYVIITKVIVIADILVPTYGYCVYPPCSSCEKDICEEILSLPLFPPSN